MIDARRRRPLVYLWPSATIADSEQDRGWTAYLENAIASRPPNGPIHKVTQRQQHIPPKKKDDEQPIHLEVRRSPYNRQQGSTARATAAISEPAGSG
jgi:hypothetical protein